MRVGIWSAGLRITSKSRETSMDDGRHDSVVNMEALNEVRILGGG